MKRRLLSLATLVLAIAALVAMPTTPAGAVDQCGSIGGTLLAGVCTVQAPGPGTIVAGTYQIDEDLLIKSGASIIVPPAGLTLNVAGNFTMEAGSLIDGSISGPGQGAPIVVNAGGDIKLNGGSPGAQIISNQNAGTCSTSSSRGGNITLIAAGNVTTENGSAIKTVSPCGKGEIIIAGVILNLDGLALSQGTTTQGRGGPITATASCNLTVSPTGQLISLGRDPGADLVHVEGGCEVKILGLVASRGPGHAGGATNRCVPPNRPDKPTNSRACVEIWAGDLLLIDSTGGNNGEVDADTGQSGGIQGRGWIDLFARGPITIVGDTAAPFAVHANQSLTNGRGGIITIKSIADIVTASGLAVQASCAPSGCRGGLVTVEAKVDVDLKGGEIEARGATTGGAPHGGTVNVRAFTGSILANASSLIDITGKAVPDGVANLVACTAIQFPPGVVTPAAATVNKTTGLCTGTPLLPLEIVSGDGKSYVKLPLCVCSCVCATGFRPTTAPSGPNLPILTINGTGLKQVTAVVFSLNCEPTEPGFQTGVIQLPKSDTALKVEVPAGLLNNTPYRVILIGPTGSCCSADFFTATP